MTNVRVLAWRILRARHATPIRLAQAVAKRAELGPRDRRLLVSLVALELRRRGTLNTLVRHFSRGRGDTSTGGHVALGLVQAFLLDRIPDHVVVAETVRAARITLGERHGRTVEIALEAALGSRMRSPRTTRAATSRCATSRSRTRCSTTRRSIRCSGPRKRSRCPCRS